MCMNGFPLMLAGQDRLGSAVVSSVKQLNLFSLTQ